MTEQDAAQWYIARDGKQTGPMTDMEIKAIAAHKYFRATDLVWRTGLAEWQPALNIFPQPAPVTPTQSPTMMPPPAPREMEAPRAIKTREPAPQPQAAGREVSYRAPSPTEVAQANSAPSPFSPTRPASASSHESTEWTAPRAPQPQPPSEQSRLPVSPPFHDQTGRPSQPAQRLEQPAQRLEQPTQRQGQPRETTQPARSAPMAQSPKKTSQRVIWAMAATVVIVSGGIWTVARPGVLQSIMGGLPAARDVFASSNTAVSTTPTAAANNVVDDPAASTDLDQRWQKTAHWQVIKREFPDWYGERLRETTKSASENKTETEITRSLVEQMIALRRQNANLALSASTPKLKALANAFLNNLRQLKEQSTTACFNFISQGEATPGLLDQFATAPGASSAMQTQVAAIFDAIGDGRKTPVIHDKPQKADYDALMAQLSKLGWSQTDVATFADPKALARAEPARVCQMVQDWFTAHISIADERAQERLLGETLRPVVSG